MAMLTGQIHDNKMYHYLPVLVSLHACTAFRLFVGIAASVYLHAVAAKAQNANGRRLEWAKITPIKTPFEQRISLKTVFDSTRFYAKGKPPYLREGKPMAQQW